MSSKDPNVCANPGLCQIRDTNEKTLAPLATRTPLPRVQEKMQKIFEIAASPSLTFGLEQDYNKSVT